MKAGWHILRGFLVLGFWCLGLNVWAQTRTVHFYYTDPQGNVLAKTDAQGNIIAQYDYTPYGTSVPSLGNPPNGPGYTGHVDDPETGHGLHAGAILPANRKVFEPRSGGTNAWEHL
ncbi:hypothetical protein [Fulvimonas soli]|jgi:YD repeat-containing protein|uniref:YD repeat-containing protein n=1 Tax=Fulvimonas soli TaxID=155197 RepID=A0A316IBH9_9GAMM|nr:hypothetical protein [Fulvimonas soli]PWK89862.1 YD repeat-containing protein [Fulvimonas soli]